MRLLLLEFALYNKAAMVFGDSNVANPHLAQIEGATLTGLRCSGPAGASAYGMIFNAGGTTSANFYDLVMDPVSGGNQHLYHIYAKRTLGLNIFGLVSTRSSNAQKTTARPRQ